MPVEWRTAEDFTSFADALGITSDLVMAARSEDGEYFWDVFFTEGNGVGPDDWVWHAVIWRKDETVEVLRQEKFRTCEQFFAELREREAALREAMEGVQ